MGAPAVMYERTLVLHGVLLLMLIACLYANVILRMSSIFNKSGHSWIEITLCKRVETSVNLFKSIDIHYNCTDKNCILVFSVELL